MTLPVHSPIKIDDQLQQQLLDAACRAADAASPITLRHFRQEVDIDNKASGHDYDPVTVADRDAEAAIREVLLEAFPQHGFFGEETQQLEQLNELLWVVDPIDGTRAYITGMPLWGTLIAVYDGCDSVLGVLDQPFLRERYIGRPSHTELHCDNRISRLQTRQVASLANAVLQTTTPDMFKTQFERNAYQRVCDRVALNRFGGDCYAYAMLAMGFIDIVIESDLQPYDIQALIPIIRGAGGVITNWQGESAVNGGAVVACGSANIHTQVLAILAG